MCVLTTNHVPYGEDYFFVLSGSQVYKGLFILKLSRYRACVALGVAAIVCYVKHLISSIPNVQIIKNMFIIRYLLSVT